MGQPSLICSSLGVGSAFTNTSPKARMKALTSFLLLGGKNVRTPLSFRFFFLAMAPSVHGSSGPTVVMHFFFGLFDGLGLFGSLGLMFLHGLLFRGLR